MLLHDMYYSIDNTRKRGLGLGRIGTILPEGRDVSHLYFCVVQKIRLIPVIRFTPPDPTFAAEWNLTYDISQLGQSGPINATFINYIPDCERSVEPAGLELGLDIVRDPVSNHESRTIRTGSDMMCFRRWMVLHRACGELLRAWIPSDAPGHTLPMFVLDSRSSAELPS